MLALLVSLLALAVGAIGALIFRNRGRWPTLFGAGGTVIGCLCGITPAVRVVLGQPSQSLRMDWNVPYGSLFLELDPLSGFFLIPIFLLCALAAIYGAEYLEDYRGRKALAPPWFFFNLLVGSMVIVILARNGVLFLMAWKVRALPHSF